MPERLFTPTYKVEGSDYVANDKNGNMSVEPSGYPGPKTLDPNKYATKKTIAQGMLDVALLTANASQLKYVLTVGEAHTFYTLMLSLISISLVLQGLIGVLIPVLAVLNINIRERQSPAQLINHSVLGLSLLTLAIDSLKMGFDGGFQPKQNVSSLTP
ncbi:ninjurin-2-like isoform X3 [Oratosquilla oratoria]|uniref:ninjurin-2-like isoform X3 n=1 Tax=Oratosquilla oratoria TaxID=337810 RepID=UPI003F7672B2